MANNKPMSLVSFDDDAEKRAKELIPEEELEKEAAKRFAKEMEGKQQSLVNFSQDPGRTKEFMVTIKGEDPTDETEIRHWEIVIGRQAAYQLFKDFIEVIDLKESYIIAQDATLDERGTAIDFMRFVLDQGLVEDPGFDPMDYIDGDLED